LTTKTMKPLTKNGFMKWGEDEKDQYEAFRKVLGKITEIEGPGTHGYRLEVRLIEYTKRGEENGSSKTDKA